MENYDQIEKYLKGEMSKEEEKLFEKQIAESKELQNEISLYKDLDVYIGDKDLQNFRKKLSQQMAGLRKTTQPATAKLFTMKRYLAAATVIILAGLAIYLSLTINKNKYQRLYANYYQVYEYSDVSRSAEDAINGEDYFQQGVNAYNQLNFAAAADQFNEALENNSEHYMAGFLLAMSYMETENTQKAIRLLQGLADNDKVLFKETSRWFLGLCYLKMEDIENASAQFEMLMSYPNFYQQKAEKIYQKLN